MTLTHNADGGLPDVLVAQARAASDATLAFIAASGMVLAVALGAWRPSHWMALVTACACVAMFGAWGIADRELRERTLSPRRTVVTLLRFARAIAAAIGVISAIILLFDLLSVTLGTWIS